MNLVTVISTETNKIAQRLIKVLRYGKNDVQTPKQVAPYGLDSNPIKDTIAIYGKTESDGSTIILGYLNKNSIAKVGEYRMFSTDTNGGEQFYIYLKDDKTCEIGGNTNFAVKYKQLEVEFNKLKTNFNKHLTEFNTHVHSGGTIMGNTGPTPVPSAETNTSDITQTKNNQIKTIG